MTACPQSEEVLEAPLAPPAGTSCLRAFLPSALCLPRSALPCPRSWMERESGKRNQEGRVSRLYYAYSPAFLAEAGGPSGYRFQDQGQAPEAVPLASHVPITVLGSELRRWLLPSSALCDAMGFSDPPAHPIMTTSTGA